MNKLTHESQVLSLLNHEIGNPEEVADIQAAARRVAERWVDPAGESQRKNGLLYGLIQSGKTGVLSVISAVGADAGYRIIVILTSDSDPLYDQTLGRAREAFPGMDIIGRDELKDQKAFVQRIKASTCVVVVTKNTNRLALLIENIKNNKTKLKADSCLIIDDEADQASMNTYASRDDGTRSKINEKLLDLRQQFKKTTYLQVTATPQALFLQDSGDEFRPQFSVLSHPGANYVGGDDFFCDNSALLRPFDIQELAALSAGSQPTPSIVLPPSLVLALDTFMIAATHKRLHHPDQNCAFLCHVSTRKGDHAHIVNLLRQYKADLSTDAKANAPRLFKRLERAYRDLASTHPDLRNDSLQDLVKAIAFFSSGMVVKLVNGDTDEDVAVKSPYNLFVGGTKLGRGVTIKNLLVSYYGRNPARPQADTVLQHARMYGYRRSDIGLLRLFLPPQLSAVFRAIHKMEAGLRTLIARAPGESFRGLYLESVVKPTRKNILVPGAVGVYAGGSNYNPAQVVRKPETDRKTRKIDALVEHIANKGTGILSIKQCCEILRNIETDSTSSEYIWNTDAVIASLLTYAEVEEKEHCHVYVDRGRKVKASRRETQGIIEGGERHAVPATALALFLLRMETRAGVAWWPQIRFADGQYAFAFAI